MENNVQTQEKPEKEISHREENKFYKIGFFVLFSVFLLMAGTVGSWYFFSKKASFTPVEPSPTIVTAKITPETPSPTVFLQETAVPTTEVPTATTVQKSDLEQIKEAMAEKYGKPIGDTIVNISKNTGTHASGGVKFEGEIAGGWLLAAKKDGEWVIVDDGNGTISCEVIEPWNFPSSIVSECVDELGNPVSR